MLFILFISLIIGIAACLMQGIMIGILGFSLSFSLWWLVARD